MSPPGPSAAGGSSARPAGKRLTALARQPTAIAGLPGFFCPVSVLSHRAKPPHLCTVNAGAQEQDKREGSIDHQTCIFHEIKITGPPRTRRKRAPRFFVRFSFMRHIAGCKRIAKERFVFPGHLKERTLGKKRRGAKERCAFLFSGCRGGCVKVRWCLKI